MLVLVMVNIQDPNVVVPVALAGWPSVPVTEGALNVAVGVAEAVLVNVKAVV